MRQYAADKREKHRIIIRTAKAVPCMDCHEEHPYYIMTFDHLGDKSGNISTKGMNPSTTTKWLLDEIAKCDIVCFNCHAERTHQRELKAGNRIIEERPTTKRLPPPGERTHCPHGHKYTQENTRIGLRGGRWCKTCGRKATNAWEKRHRRIKGIRRPKTAEELVA